MNKNFRFFDKATGETFIVVEDDFITAMELATQYWGDDIEFIDIADEMGEIKED